MSSKWGPLDSSGWTCNHGNLKNTVSVLDCRCYYLRRNQGVDVSAEGLWQTEGSLAQHKKSRSRACVFERPAMHVGARQHEMHLYLKGRCRCRRAINFFVAVAKHTSTKSPALSL